MCAIFNYYNCPFKWITYLVLTIGVYTFLYWFLGIPLLYFHFYECCNDKWSRNWIAWFLAIAFGCWFGISILIILIWFCLRFCKVRHLNQSNVRLTEKKDRKNEEKEAIEKAKAVFFEKKRIDAENNTLESIKESAKEIVGLPEFDSKDSFTVLQVNESQQDNESPVSGTECPIPVEESRHYVQNDSPQPETEDKPVKTPREIFFQDLIESAPKTPLYFDFDPEKISQDIKNKYALEKRELREESQEDTPRDNDYFLGSHVEKPNLTSEVLITLNENGVVEDEPVVLGNYQILKE